MNRRMILLAAAAAATASPALAQTASQSQVGDAEKTHAEKTAAIGGASLQMANIAMQKATHPKVREFAKFEHDATDLNAAAVRLGLETVIRGATEETTSGGDRLRRDYRGKVP